MSDIHPKLDQIRAAAKDFIDKAVQCGSSCEQAFLQYGEGGRAAALIDVELDQLQAHVITVESRLTNADADPQLLAIVQDVKVAAEGAYRTVRQMEIPARDKVLIASKSLAAVTLHLNRLRDAARLSEYSRAGVEATRVAHNNPPEPTAPPSKILGKRRKGKSKGVRAPKQRQGVMSLEAKAMGVLADHPDWTEEQIAKAAGCNRGSLYRLKLYRRARALSRHGGSSIPRGSKNKGTGQMEAWE